MTNLVESKEAKIQRILEMEERIRLREGLPFLYGWKWYTWAREFYESTNKVCLLTAANQCSKSSTAIRKCINWATDKSLWPSLWVRDPSQFWYLYPTTNQATIEFKTKWPQFLPKNEFQNDPKYGWKPEFKHGDIHAIHFNSGVHVYFKTYSQKTDALQTGTVDAMWCDEEVPVNYYNELVFRLSASDGYFNTVFTATLGQDFWRRAMEPEQGEEEVLPGAFKRTVSMYDCLTYEDGTPSHWSVEKIQQIEARCTSHNEILKRVHGKFILDIGGRKYPHFNIKRHLMEPREIPSDWMIYGAADPGSGGVNHPAAISFMAVNPNMREAEIFLGWRGDHELTTAGDVVEKFISMRDDKKLNMQVQRYDQACKDFQTISTRMGEAFEQSDKNHEKGEQVLNTLFKYDMLKIHNNVELMKMAVEFSVLKKDTPKNKAKDDLSDTARYNCTSIPWDFSFITGELLQAPEKVLTPMEREIAERRAAFDENEDEKAQRELDEEFREFNELLYL